jgi:hypothetical protein
MEIDRVRAQFEALLLQPLLEPLGEAFGEYSDIAIDAFSTALAGALHD